MEDDPSASQTRRTNLNSVIRRTRNSPYEYHSGLLPIAPIVEVLVAKALLTANRPNCPAAWEKKSTAREGVARTRKKRGFIAMEAPWPLAASVAAGALLLGFAILPAIFRSNPFTVGLITPAHVGFGIFALLYSGIALVNLLTILGSAKRQPDANAAKGIAHDSNRPANARASGQATQCSLELLKAMEWKRFEDLCAAYYQAKGIACATTPLGADGGIDIRLFQGEDKNQATAVVQCKAWGDRPVGIKPVRELLGVMTHQKIAKGFFMTAGGFTAAAREFAEPNGITLLDGKLFLAMINRLPSEASQRLLRLATEGDYTTPTCPSCGIKMVKRTGSKGSFWGCKNFLRCMQTLPMRQGVPFLNGQGAL